MSDTLINRLRGIYDASNGEFEARDFSAFIPPISLEAASAIESLEADKELLKKDADAYKLYISEQEAEKAILTANLDHFKQCYFNAQSFVIREFGHDPEQEDMMNDLKKELIQGVR